MGRCTASWAVLRVCSHCISFEASEVRNRRCSNGILTCVWAAVPCLTVRSEDLVCIKLRSSCDCANLHTVTGPSAHLAVFIVHRVVGSPVLQRKWTRPVDLISVARFGAHPPLQGSDSYQTYFHIWRRPDSNLTIPEFRETWVEKNRNWVTAPLFVSYSNEHVLFFSSFTKNLLISNDLFLFSLVFVRMLAPYWFIKSGWEISQA